MVYVFEVQKPFPFLGLEPGEILIVVPGGVLPVLRCTRLPPNFGAVVGAWETEAIRWVMPPEQASELEQAVGLLDSASSSSSAPTPAASPDRSPRHLGLLR
jgi:hypothetical protein